MRGVTIHFDAVASLEQRGDHWAAYVEPLGLTVYGDTRAEAEARVSEGVDFFLKYAPDVPRYLASHSVPYQIRREDKE